MLDVRMGVSVAWSPNFVLLWNVVVEKARREDGFCLMPVTRTDLMRRGAHDYKI